MASSSGISIQPAEVTEATKQLDELATRIERVMQTEAPALSVVASAHDEVSQRVATTLNEVHTSFTKSSNKGINELREAAATLRAQNAGVIGADQDVAV